MDINKKKEILLITDRIVKNERGSFTIDGLKEKIHNRLKCRNFKNVSENNKEIESFINRMKTDKKLFKYNEQDNRYFYVH